MASKRTSLTITIQVLLDILIYLAITAGFILLYGYVPPTERGFRCDDVSISYPEVPETVPMLYLGAVALGAPVITIFLMEGYWKILRPRRKDGRHVEYMVAVGKETGLFFYALSLAMLVTEVIKLATGVLRPNFLDACRPLPYNCTDGYVYSVECNNPELKQWELYNIRKGFPSAHATFATYSATFVTIYLEYRFITPYSVFLKSMLQVAGWCLALFCASSRVKDNRHQMGDVVAGMVIGVAFALWSVFFLSKHIRREGYTLSDVGGEHTTLLETKFSPRPGEQDHPDGNIV